MTSSSPELDLGPCQCCGNEPAVGVASVPGAPISIAWGRECLRQNATPLWVADFNVGSCIPVSDPRWDHMAEWAQDQTVYVDGEYKHVGDLELRIIDCPHDVPDGEPCQLCFEGKIVTIDPP